MSLLGFSAGRSTSVHGFVATQRRRRASPHTECSVLMMRQPTRLTCDGQRRGQETWA
jgi:hypothetical protein